MKTIMTLLAAVVLSSCALAQNALQSDGGTIDSEPAPVYLYPNDPPEAMCNGMIGDITIPCNRVLDVCIDTPDGTSSKWVPEFVRCTDAHPRWDDVCRIAPPEEWAFYGYTPEECSAVLP
jgi:hypothetical protein